LATSTTKKAVIRRFQRESLAGYVNPLSYLQATGVELLSAEARFVNVPYAEIKTVSFVRDFDAAPEVERPVFLNRPEDGGSLDAIHLRDGEVMEGIMPNNLLPVEPYGFSVIPPHPYSAAAARVSAAPGVAFGGSVGGGGQSAQTAQGKGRARSSDRSGSANRVLRI